MLKRLVLNETITSIGEILESDRSKLRPGVLSRVKYNICNVGEMNRNKRIYERSVWDKVLSDPDIKEKLEKRTLFMHAEHPSGMSSNTEKIAGIVTEFVIDEANNKVYNVVEVLDTPYGRVVEVLLNAGCGLGVSTRAEGELEECIDESKGKFYRVIPESYQYVTTDFTSDPSTYGTYPESVERDLVTTVKDGLEAKKIDKQYATVILEKMRVKEAVALLESLKEKEPIAEFVTSSTTSGSTSSRITVTMKEDKKPIFNRKLKENSKHFSDLHIELPDSEGGFKSYYADIDVSYYVDSNYGADADGNRGTPMLFIDDVNINNVVDDEGKSVPVTDDLISKIESKAEELDLSERKVINEKGGTYTVGFEELMKEFEKAKDSLFSNDDLKKLTESKSVKTVASIIQSFCRKLMEKISILSAEKAKLLEISEDTIFSIKSMYSKDVVDYNAKISKLEEKIKETEEWISKSKVQTESLLNEMKESFEDEKIQLAEKVGNEAIDATIRIYEAKTKELKESLDKQLKDARSHYDRELFKVNVNIKVKESGLEKALTKGHLTLLESCESEVEIVERLADFRQQIKEGSFYSSEFKKETVEVAIDEGKTERQKKEEQDMIGTTRNLLKTMK